jgi:toxin-antitoxin system PIN domain toxin
MSACLLDVNTLLALCDPRHVHHEPAHAWFASARASGWATCPITENGFVRIASQPAYPNRPGGPAAVAALLRTFCTDSQHLFWADQASLLDRQAFRLEDRLTPGQVTDVYLLALAVRNGGRLATFDATVPVWAVSGGADALVVLPS